MKKKKTMIGLAIIFALGVSIGLAHFYRSLLGRDVLNEDHEEMFIHIPTGSGFDKVMELLIDSGLVKNPTEFRWLAMQMKYDERVRPGNVS